MADINYKSYADVSDVIIKDALFDPIKEGYGRYEFDDILKFSNVQRGAVANIRVYGGRENSIDINRFCKSIAINGARLEGARVCAVVIKGESAEITLENIVIEGDANYDIEIGGWADRAFGKTTKVRLINVVRANGKPVRVVVGRADFPTIEGGNVKILAFRSLALKAFWWGKYLLRKTKLA